MSAFELAKRSYDNKVWSKEMLEALMKLGKLTQEEYELILKSE